MQYPKHTDLADFFINPDGKLSCSLNIDWKNFNITHEAYFNGDENYSADEYEAVYKAVCEESGRNDDYTIDCYNDCYTVRSKSEAENLRYNEQEQKLNHSWQKRFERNQFLAVTDKFMLPDYPITDEEREQYKQYREYLRDLPETEGFPDVEILAFADWNNKAI